MALHMRSGNVTVLVLVLVLVLCQAASVTAFGAGNIGQPQTNCNPLLC